MKKSANELHHIIPNSQQYIAKNMGHGEISLIHTNCRWTMDNKSEKKTLDKVKQKISDIKKQLGAIYLAYRHPNIPWYAKAVALVVVGYALSPIDLIPDFIPILGVIDDMVLLPLGIMLAVKLIPGDIMTECREQLKTGQAMNLQNKWIVGGVIIAIWVGIVGMIIKKIYT